MPYLVARSWLAITCAAFLSACASETPSSPPPTEDPPTVPYDGPWAQLPETGEWTDRGALSACTVPGPQPSKCYDPARIDLSGCDQASLASLELRGAIYLTEMRNELRARSIHPMSGGFRFDANGRLVTLLERPASGETQLNGLPFRLRSDSGKSAFTEIDFGDGYAFTFIGCQATSPRTLTGCFVLCRNDLVLSHGTFRAERMTWRENEPEASGLALVSESHVAQGTPMDVYVTRGHAYVVSVPRLGNPGGLTVLDVSDPRNPVYRAAISLPNDSFWNGVWAKDEALYIASATSGVLIFDITDPARPAFVRNETGNIPGPVDVHTVFVEGDRLYAMSPSAKQTLIFDVSAPLSPTLVSSYAYPNATSIPHDAFASGGRLYINHGKDGFLVVDVTSEQPALLGKYTFPYVFSHANAVGVFNGRTIAFEGGEGQGTHLRVLDVTNPVGIAKVGEYRLRDLTSIHNMVLVGSRLYIAHYHEGVRVLDVSDPTRPREVAHFNSFRETDPGRTDRLFDGAIGIRVPGDGYVYVVDKARGLLILDEP
ncbi:LVIVD repeat-containing protein [Pyxidicoccus sp. 3LG]